MIMVQKILWGLASIFILISSIYFTLKLRFIQFNFREMFKSLFSKEYKGEEVSPIKSFLLSLGGRIGVGSIAGVALSIYVGGVGTIFWMWITSILSVANAFAETVLGNIYKQKDENEIYKGGPSYYLRSGLGNQCLGALYAIIIIVSYIGGFLSVQSNTITKSLIEIYPVSSYIVGIILSLVTFFIIFGGLKKIIDASSKLVPVMAIIYLGMSFIIIFINITKIPSVLIYILKEAFNFKSFLFGFVPMFIIGLQRGIFSSEAGLGTGSIASSTSSDHNSIKQGFIQMAGIYISLLICTVTVFVILLSDIQHMNFVNVNGIEIVQSAFQSHLGNFGVILIFVSIVLFSFSTIIAGYYYGENSLKYLFNKPSKTKLLILKIVTIAIVFMGCIVPATILWDLVDTMVAILAIVNIYALLSLRKEIIVELDCQQYRKYDKMGK